MGTVLLNFGGIIFCIDSGRSPDSVQFGKPYRYLGQIDLGNTAKVTHCL